MTRLLLPLLLLLVGCGASLESPSYPLPIDREYDRMLSIWVERGLPDPGQCGREAVIVYPASDRDIEVWCKAKPCGTQEPGAPCVDACQSSRFEGPWADRTALLIVQKRQPRRTYRHELGHLWQQCTGLPRKDSPEFCTWLDVVEGSPPDGKCVGQS